MSRLTAAPARLARLPAARASLAPAQPRDIRARLDRAPWRRWYSLKRWKGPVGLRMQAIRRDGWRCQRPGCGFCSGNPSAFVVDHITPHKGDEALFWDLDNLQTLCKPCHDGWKQSIERGSKARRQVGG